MKATRDMLEHVGAVVGGLRMSTTAPNADKARKALRATEKAISEAVAADGRGELAEGHIRDVLTCIEPVAIIFVKDAGQIKDASLLETLARELRTKAEGDGLLT